MHTQLETPLWLLFNPCDFHRKSYSLPTYLDMDVIVDIQALYDKEARFLPKEVAVVTMQNDFIGHWIVAPPYDFSELPRRIALNNNSLTCFHHGLEWIDGDTSIEKLFLNLRAVTRYAIRIYVRGLQKAELLRSVLGRDIVNLEDFEGPPFRKMPTSETYCIYHGIANDDLTKCALNNAMRIKRWLILKHAEAVTPIYTEPMITSTPKARSYHPPRPQPIGRGCKPTKLDFSKSSDKSVCFEYIDKSVSSASHSLETYASPHTPKNSTNVDGSLSGENDFKGFYRRSKSPAPLYVAPTPPPRSRHNICSAVNNEQCRGTKSAAASNSADERCLSSRPDSEMLV